MFLAMPSQYPDVLEAAVPVIAVFDALGSGSAMLFFQIVLFGTFIETGVGLIHGFNERIVSVHQRLSNQWRAGVALGLLIISAFIANTIGIIGFISKGYGALIWGHWIVFVIPVLTIGVRKVLKL